LAALPGPHPEATGAPGRSRRRAERQRDADAKLREELIEAGGCVVRGPALDDVSAIRAALADGIPMDVITTAIRSKCDRRMYPKNDPAASWREERILRAIADLFCRRLVRNMGATWSAAGSTPQTPVETPAASPAVQGAVRPRRRAS
jgi:hypothetical protein